MELISPERAAKIVGLGFPDGGYRMCRKCQKTMKATKEQIIEWTCEGIPRCRLCGGRTELLTPEENEKLR